MKFFINDEQINIFLYYARLLIINLGTFYIFEKISSEENKINWKNENIIIIILILAITFIELFIKRVGSYFYGAVMNIVLLELVFELFNKNLKVNITILTILSICLSNIIFFGSLAINSIPNVWFNIKNDFLAFPFIVLIYILGIIKLGRIKKLNRGMTFLNSKNKNYSYFYGLLMLNICTIIVVFLAMLKDSDRLRGGRFVLGFVVLSIIMFITIHKLFQIYYNQRLLTKQLEDVNNQLIEKENEIKKLEKENLNFSKRSHSMAHKQEALEYKLNQLLMNEETTKEIGIAAEIKELSKELYQKPIEELTKTGIQKIDDMLKFMQSECIKNNIDINLQITGNVYHIINNIITVEQLEILIADHIKDAIIAIKHTDNVNKSILVKLGKIDECYGLYIYDSGIEFEKETLENLGKKPSTTHKDEGGTGMGFMNTFDTLRSCKGSLIIKEIGKPSKDNFTKIIMIKFDGKNEYKVISYR